ncbi:PREDICTED: nudix hydrolase 17, mitochondrial [Camelina sativa]|uniref:Nudix hydrolase 17, mitochondrial n=1 Tax=Camelina sativa TaxID=90675 RepID=A0ABM0YJX7_CAMSA|nr:PREDICTED: nudix hydrolase 17, mitochondrial [Camelina sativa]XP_010502149.1 PREDICTED: nudix hydrolase 17, mitochondrial [Camelina sativa]
MGVEKMVCLASRTGRQFQRYNKGRRQVVGCVPYRFKLSNDGKISDEVEVLVISSQKGHALMFPKGGWELDESVEEAASRECREEAGVLGNIEHQLGKWDFLSKSRGTYYEGLMFPMLVTEQLELWPEQHLRQRIWMNVTEAREACRDWWMKEALDVLVERLSSPMNQPKEEKTISISIETMC